MKKTLLTITILASSTILTAAPLSTTELKSMDCAALAVEKANASRVLSTSETKATGKTISKWAGLASSALNAFGGGSDTASKAGGFANKVSTESDLGQVDTQLMTDAQANIENIAIYQNSKKCSV